MNGKNKVIAQMKAFASRGEGADWQKVSHWVDWLTAEEQLNSPVAEGPQRVGGSSVPQSAVCFELTEMYVKLRRWQMALPKVGDVLVRQHVGRVCHEIDKLFDLLEESTQVEQGSETPLPTG